MTLEIVNLPIVEVVQVESLRVLHEVSNMVQISAEQNKN